MKQTLLVLTLVACSVFGYAQSFTVSPSNAVSMTATDNVESDGWIYFANDRTTPITLVWELNTTTMQDTNWHVQICDNNICYDGLQTTKTMAPIDPSKQAFLKFIVTPTFGTTISGTTSFDVFIENEPSTSVTVTFTVNNVVGIDGSELETSISISPNPATDVLNLRATNGGTLEKGTTQVFDLSGRMLYSQQIQGLASSSIEVSNLPTGTYLMRYTTKDGVVTKKFVHTN